MAASFTLLRQFADGPSRGRSPLRYLAVCLALAVPALAHAGPLDADKPTAWPQRVQPLDSVQKITMEPVDVEALKAEDARNAETGEKSLRYAANIKVDLTPAADGT